MKTLDRYIGIHLGNGFVLVLLILLSIFSFLAFVEALDDVGVGQYQLGDACLAILLTLPRRIIDLAPITALLGSLIALGRLANGAELLAMQACGMSATRISLSVLKTGSLFILAVLILEFGIAPPLEQLAQSRHSVLTSGIDSLRTEQGFWFRNGRSFINIGRIKHGGVPADIDIYELDERGHLQTFTQAREAKIQRDNEWVLMDITQTSINQDDITIQRYPTTIQDNLLTPEQISLLVLPPESLSPLDLYQYAHYLKEHGQNADRHDLALWKKASMPAATGAMIVMAIPFVFGPLRAVSAGWRMMVGAMLGIAFHLSTQIAGNIGLLFELHPAITTMLPIAAVLAIAVALLREI
ncbi:MAG TPA: LPS export ABC transporter permease LptG [Nitrospirales bacterium]|nr:LPS export ABC transporter permease LptG [Nitrospirales bacterium]HIN33961.1 LPS export ABC transporter permease LptG [Nitrospirales bacterium]